MRIKWFSLVRITGLVLVLTYHFFQNQFPGGFIGVDIFFTFSGFLITALMVDEFGRSRDFKLLAFYRRRFYRIVPPLVLSVLLVVPLTFLVGRDFVTGLGRQIAAALGFVTNYFEIATGGSYENKFIPHLFVHTWSLAVEMHFYIIWGILAFVIAKAVQHWAPPTRHQTSTASLPMFRLALFILAIGLAVYSFMSMFLRAAGLSDFSPVYFSSVTHGFPFFVGSALGTVTGIRYVAPSFQRSWRAWTWQSAAGVMALSALTLIVLGDLLQFDQLITYRGGLLLATLLACVMIFSARVLHEKTPNVPEPKPITFLADVSYSVYLFHWPLYVIFSHLMTNWVAALVTTILSIVLSALSYYSLEPLIAGKPAHFFKWPLQWRLVKWPFLILTAGLTLLTIQVTRTAPQLSRLETNLWLSGITQDVDKLNATQAIATAKPAPAVKAATVTGTKPAKGVSIIGDSVTLGTRDYLGAHVADSSIDAEGDRTMDLAYKVMMEQQKNHLLREYVVICIGTNALNDYQEQLMKVVNDLAPGHKLVLMTPYNAQATASWNSSKLGELERSLPKKYNFITIADWGKAAPKHPDAFKGTDGVHFGGIHAGDVAYAQVINDALKVAQTRPAKAK